MLFDFFDVREVVPFATQISKDIDFLLQASASDSKKKASKNGSGRFDILLGKIRDFSRKNRLNIYKKAKLLNLIKWSLRESGYDSSQIDEVMVLLAAALHE